MPESLKNNISVIQLDLLNEASLSVIPKDIDCAYYLVHSMASSVGERKAIGGQIQVNPTSTL